MREPGSIENGVSRPLVALMPAPPPQPPPSLPPPQQQHHHHHHHPTALSQQPHAHVNAGTFSSGAQYHPQYQNGVAAPSFQQQDDPNNKDPDYQRLLASLFSPDDDDAWLFEDDGEAFDPTYNPDEESDESDDDIEEMQISEKELQFLLNDSEDPPPAPRSDRQQKHQQQPSSAGASSSSAFVRPAMSRGAPILPRTFQNFMQHTTTINYGDVAKSPMRDAQRTQLARQLTQHYQLLIQTAALLALQTQKEQEAGSPMEILHRHCYTNVQYLIRQLKALRDAAWKQLRFEPGPKGTGIYAPPPTIASGGPASSAHGGGGGGGSSSSSSAHAVAHRPLKKTKIVETRRWTRHDFVRLEGHSSSLFDLPGHAAGEEIMRSIDRIFGGVEELVDGDESLEPWTEGMMADLGKAGQKIYPDRVICRVRKLAPLDLQPQYEAGRRNAAQFKPLPMMLFTPAEQRLFVMGLEKLGERQWAMIGVDFLPPRSIQALQWFYAVQTAGAAPPNLVKDVLARRVAAANGVTTTSSAFTAKEDMALWNGVKRCGEDWPRLCKDIFPRRSAADLQQRYRVLCQNPPTGKGKKGTATARQPGGEQGARGGKKKKAGGSSSGQLPPQSPPPTYYEDMSEHELEDIGISMDSFPSLSPGFATRLRPSPAQRQHSSSSSSYHPQHQQQPVGTRDGPWRRSLSIGGQQQHQVARRGRAEDDDDDDYEKESIASSSEEEGDEEEEEEGGGRGGSSSTGIRGVMEGREAPRWRRKTAATRQHQQEEDDDDDDDDEYEREEIPSDEEEDDDNDDDGGHHNHRHGDKEDRHKQQQVEDEDDEYEHESIRSSDEEDS